VATVIFTGRKPKYWNQPKPSPIVAIQVQGQSSGCSEVELSFYHETFGSPSMAGWWKCHKCLQLNKTAFQTIHCMFCDHIKCEACREVKT
jgi:hypothetical protein